MAPESSTSDGQNRDFFEAFGVGVPGGPMHPIDVGGVTYAAIHALHEMTQRSQSALDELRSRIERASEQQTNLLQRIERLRRP